MTHYADPRRCPDCGAAITPGAPACTACGLPLGGELAQRLYTTLLTADRLLVELRAVAATATVVAPAPGGPVPAGTLPAPAPPVPARRLRAVSVPKILLALGAGCVLVAALVFLAVTWSVMGVGGRTATLVALTVGCGLLTGWLARRDLRAGAEALALVTLGLFTLDLFGADDAGWFGDLPEAAFFLLLGVALVAAGGAAALAARRTPIGVLTGAEVVVGLGAAAAAFGTATLDGVETSPAAVAAVLVAAAVTLLGGRLDLVWALRSAAGVTVVFWLALLTVAAERAGEHADLTGLWLDLHVWPLLATAALAAALSPVRQAPLWLRVAAASAAYAVATLALLFPALDESATTAVGVVVVALTATALLTWRAPSPWWPAGSVVQAAGGLALLSLGVGLGAVAAQRVTEAAVPVWAGTTSGRLTPWSPGEDGPAAWLLPLLVLALLATAAALGSRLPSGARTLAAYRPARGTTATAAAAVLAAAGIATLALYAVPVWTVVVLATTATSGFVAGWLRTGSVAPLVASAAFLPVALVASMHDDVLTALMLAAAALLAGLVHLRARRAELSAVAGAVLAVAVAADVWSWSHVAGATEPWAALLTLAVVGLAILPVHLLPATLWSHPELSVARAGLEVGAAVAAVPVALAGVLDAAPDTELTWTAVYLTVAGVVVTALALLRPDRPWLLPVGGLLLVAASWVRLWEIGVRAPEAYTMPSAAVLAAVGLLHLHRRPGSSTQLALGPALGLALVPSLLWALAEEPGLRALLLGTGCLALILAGAHVKWTAPLLWGAVVGGLLVVRLASPYVEDAVPTWVLIGSAGALLIALGVTWEQRLQETRRLVGYVRGLR